MGLFGSQFANVVEWQEYNDDTIFWKWNNDEIKKGSSLCAAALDMEDILNNRHMLLLSSKIGLYLSYILRIL